MALPFAAVATDLRTGTTVVFRPRPGRAGRARLGSHPWRLRARDDRRPDAGLRRSDQPGAGGNVARSLGATVVIAVAIPAAAPTKAPVTPIEVAYHAITVMAAEIGRLRAREATVVITPDVGDTAYDDFFLEKNSSSRRERPPLLRRSPRSKRRSPQQQNNLDRKED